MTFFIIELRHHSITYAVTFPKNITFYRIPILSERKVCDRPRDRQISQNGAS